MNNVTLNNSGHGPLQVPGFGGVPLYLELPPESRFGHVGEWRQTPGVTAREQAMVATMNTLTDKSRWEIDIFDEETAAKWREEIFRTTPLMSKKGWDWCLDELRDKAVYYREHGHVRVLDTGTCVCKSDTSELVTLAAGFRTAVSPLFKEQVGKEDWEPESNEQVLNIVDPSLFPLVYGKSLVLEDAGQVVDLRDVFNCFKKARVAPKHVDRRTDSGDVQDNIKRLGSRTPASGVYSSFETHDFYRWSTNYQWLPCEAEFVEETGSEMRVTSYINNLHPDHKSLYRLIGKLISKSVKLWNDCLVLGRIRDRWDQSQYGPVPLRILTYGIEWENELPEWAMAFNVPPKSMQRKYREAQEALQSCIYDETDEGKEKQRQVQRTLYTMRHIAGRERMEMPLPDSHLWQLVREYLQLPESGSATPVTIPENLMETQFTTWGFLTRKQQRLLHFKHPEPGTSFSYEDWKTGKNTDKAIIDMVRERPDWIGRQWDPKVQPHNPYSIALQDTFRRQGLQVIVKLDSVELTPQQPSYLGGTWKLDGQLNEHIIAVAVFVYDVQNVTELRMAFRQQTWMDECFYQYAEERYTGVEPDPRSKPSHRHGKSAGLEIKALAQILDMDVNNLLHDYPGTKAFQNAGSISIPQGRLMTFPNTMECCLQPIEIVDPTIPGHHRCVKLYLVDPNYRVCSTRNVPPQQHDWWTQRVSDAFTTIGIPQEIIDQIMQATNSWPMSPREAREHRLKLMEEHLWNDMVRIGAMPGYGFQ